MKENAVSDLRKLEFLPFSCELDGESCCFESSVIKEKGREKKELLGKLKIVLLSKISVCCSFSFVMSTAHKEGLGWE